MPTVPFPGIGAMMRTPRARRLNAMSSDRFKFVLIDPKSVEFNLYAKLERHYLAKLPDEENPIITDPMKVVGMLFI